MVFKSSSVQVSRSSAATIRRCVQSMLVGLFAFIGLNLPATAAELACTPTGGFTNCVQFTYSGADQTFTVPAGVSSIETRVFGAGGGGTNQLYWPNQAGGAAGGFAKGTVAVTGGAALTIVTGQGGLVNSTAITYGGGGAGGLSTGGVNIAPNIPANRIGGSGGGMSAVFKGSKTAANSLLIAGGGGAASPGAPTLGANAAGGGGGATGGQDTTPVSSGRGGTQVAGGAAATGVSSCSVAQTAGSQFQGGNGGSANGGISTEGGGGGGGGYFGGGGGLCQGATANGTTAFQNGMGGGGSSFIGGTGVSAATTTAGGNSVNGNPCSVNSASGGAADTQYVAGIGTGSCFAAGGNGLVVIQWTPKTTLTVVKISNGATGSFSFTGDNGFVSDTFATVTSGVAASGTPKVLTTAGAITTITESATAGYKLTAASCVITGAGAALGTATPNLATGTIVLDAAATASTSTAGTDIICTYTNTRDTDLTISKTDSLTIYGPNQSLSYTVLASNAGPGGSNNAIFTDPVIANLTMASVTCGSATGSAVCPTAGNTTVALMQGSGIVIPTFPSGGSVTFTVTGTVSSSATGNLTNTASIATAVASQEINSANNSASDTDTLAPSFGACDSRMFMLRNTPTLTDFIDTTTNPFTFTNMGTAASSTITDHNADGFYPSDGYIYAINNPNLIRVQSDGTTTNLGAVTGLPVGFYNAGDISPSGILYVKSSVSSNALYSVDIATKVATLITLSSSIAVGDFAWSGGFLWTVSTASGNLLKIDLTTGVVTNVGSTGIAAFNFGGMYGAPNGVWGSENTGKFYQFNMTTGKATLISTIPAASTNDGAHCGTANIVFGANFAVTKTDSSTTYVAGSTTHTYTMTVKNNGPFGALNNTFSDPLPAGITTANWTCSAPVTSTCAASGTGAINDSTLSLAVGDTATYTSIITIPGSKIGALTNTATVTPGASTTDPVLTDNSATDTDTSAAATVTLTKISNGGVGPFIFNTVASNGFAAQTITTTSSGVGLTGALQKLTALNTNTTLTETAVAGYTLAATCVDSNQANSGNPTGTIGSLSGNVYTIPSTNVVAGANFACSFTNTKTPTLKVQKTSLGGFGGPFSFAQTNLVSTPANISTAAANTATPAAPIAINVTTIGTDITLTETPFTGYALTAASCTDANSAITTNTGSFGTLAGNVLTVASTKVLAGADFTCSFTNTKLPTVTLTKISNGGVGAFTFNGDNGFGADSITTAFSGTGVLGSTKTLSVASAITTVTETIPTGYVLASATCTGMGSSGTAVPNLATGALELNAAATAAGSNIACTFTNTKLPTVTLTKISNGAIGAFSFNGDNGFGADSITTVNSGTGALGSTKILSAASAITTITETIPTGYVLASATCTGMGSSGTAVPNLATGALELNAAATAAGSNIACTFTNTKTPTLKVQKTTLGGFGGPFSFAQTNLASTPAAISTAAVNTATPAAPTAINVTTLGTDITLTETPLSNYTLTTASCTDANSATTNNIGTFGTLAGNVLTIPNTMVVAGADFTCNFTNTLTTVGFTKTNNGPWVPGQAALGVATAKYTLTINPSAPLASTTISDTLPAGLWPGWYGTYTTGDFSCTYSLPSAAKQVTVTCTAASVPAGAQTIELAVYVDQLAVGAVSNTATFVSGSLSGSTTASTTTVSPINEVPSTNTCSVAGGTTGTNLFANNGTFGSLASNTVGYPTQPNTNGGAITSGTTDYTYVPIGRVNTNKYELTNRLNNDENGRDNDWNWVIGEHTGLASTAGKSDPNGLMFVADADTLPGVMYRETLTVTPFTNYEFSNWAAHANNPTGAYWGNGSNPILPYNIRLVINRIGVDDNNNGTIDEAGEEQTILDPDSVNATSPATWKQFSALFNSGNATQIIFAIRNDGVGGNGNDVAIDDLKVAPCTNLPAGSVQGTLYFDDNRNDALNGTELGRLPANIAVELVDSNGLTVATAYTDATGAYQFTNILVGSYTLRVVTTDPDIPAGATLGTPNNLAVSVTNAGSVTTDFGFDRIALTLAKTWVKAVPNNAASITATRSSTVLDTLASVANTADETDSALTPVTVIVGDSIVLAEAYSNGAATDYATTMACTGTAGLSGNTLTVGASDTNITCTLTNTKLPTLTLTKISVGAVDTFGFNGTNGFGTDSITTLTPGVGKLGATKTLAALGLPTTITESMQAGYSMLAGSCTGLVSGTAAANLAAGTLTLDAATAVAGANIACTLTNANQTTVILTKISNGGVGTFTFSGDNGFGSDSITTLTAGSGATGASKILTATGVTTTITESIPSGYAITDASCSGLGSTGTAVLNSTTGALVLDAAATVAGSNIACTFTNTLVEADLAITKANGVSNSAAAGTTSYTVTVTNNGPATATGAILSDPVAVGLTKSSVVCSATPGQCATPPTVAELESGTFALPSLANGQTYQITVAANVTATSGSVSNVASIAVPPGFTDSTPGNNSVTDTDTIDEVSNLAISKTGSASARVGNTATYNLVIWNQGPSSTTAATIADAVPANLTGVNWTCAASGTATCGTASGSGNAISFASGLLPVNASATPPTTGDYVTVSITGTTSAIGVVANTATVTAASGVTDPTPANNTSSANTYVTPNDATCSALYGINTAIAPADGIFVVNPASGVATPIGSKSINSATLAVQPGTGKLYYTNQYSPIKTYVWDPATGATTQLPTTAAVIESIKGAFTASGKFYISSGSNVLAEINPTTGALISSGTITLESGGALPTASGDMVFDASGTSYYSASNALYTVNVVTLKAKQIAFYSVGLAFNGLSFDSSNNLIGSAAGGSNTIYRINPSTGALTLLGSDPASYSDLASCALPAAPIQAISKSVAKVAGNAGAQINPGDTLEYTITVTNSGSLPATFVTLTDAIPAGATYLAASTKLNGSAVTDSAGPTFPFATAAFVNGVSRSSGILGATANGNIATIVFRVTVNNGPPPASVSNQATVNSLSGSAVLSDDPAIGGTTDPTVTTITPLVIVAQDDSATGINGLAGQSAVLNVLADNGSGEDTLNGVDATLATTQISITTPATAIGGGPIPVLNPATGLVDVPAGTPAGNYTIVYDLCEILNPSNCHSATITLTVQASIITLSKTITNDNGGTATVAMFTLTATGPTTISGATTSTAVTNAVVNPGIYTLSESGPAGYTAGNWVCVGGSLTDSTLTLALNQSASCTLNNNDTPATITLTKISNGGFGNFTFNGDNGFGAQTIATASSGLGVSGAPQTLTTAGLVTTITEAIPSGYALASATCTGLESSGTAVPNLLTGALVLDAAATIAGSNIACTFTNATASFTVAKSVNLATIAGPGPLAYTITAVNTGNANLTVPTLTDALTLGASPRSLSSGPTLNAGGDANTNGVFDAGEAWVYTATYNVTQADIDAGGTLSNTATFDTAETPSTSSSAATTTISQTKSLGIAKVQDTYTDVDASNSVTLNDLLHYTVTMTNTGTVTQTSVVVSDPLLTPSSLTCPSVAPLGTCILIGTHQVSQAEVDAGKVSNTAAVTSPETPGPTTVGPVDTSVAQVKTLTIAKAMTGNNDEDTTTSVTLNDTLNYKVTMTNTGTVTQTSVVVSDPLLTPSSLTCPSVAPLGTCILIGTHQVSQAEVDARKVSNTATVKSTENPTPASVGPIDTSVTQKISAAADSAGPIDGFVGNPNVANVYSNDKLNGITVTPASVTGTILTPATPAAPGKPVPSLDPSTGQVSVPPGTPAGTYLILYQICDKLNPSNCAQASISVTVESGLGTLAGTIYEDSNSTGTLDPSEPRKGGYTVQLLKDGVVVATTTSAADGSYTFTDIPPDNGYTISATSPSGVVVTGKGAFAIGAQENVVDVNLAIDPSGVVYSAVTRLPIAGATLQLTTATGTVLPAACLAAPTQQGQVTDATGQYRFDIAVGAAPECPVGQTEYRIRVTSPPGYVSGVAPSIPPTAGPLNTLTCPIDATPGGSCEVQSQATAPAVGATTTYYLSFKIGAGSKDVIHNHIPLDTVPVVPSSGLTVEKTAGVRVAHVGDVVPYQINVNNANLGAAGQLSVIDSLPAGFVYEPNSATVAGTPTEPTIAGRKLSFGGVIVLASGSVVITLNVRIGTNVTPGDLVNDGYAADPATGNLISNRAHASVRVDVEPVFDCGDIIGKVYDDKNQSGTQDEGEPGLAGVRVATVKGTLITTDKNGRFSVPCADLPDKDIGSNFVLKLDTRTLPTGYHVTTENPRVVRLTAGKAAKLNFGAALSKVVRIDLASKAFAEGSTKASPALVAGIDTLVAKLRQDPSVLRLTYSMAGDDDEALATARLKMVEALVQKKWRAMGGSKLAIETRVVAAQ